MGKITRIKGIDDVVLGIVLFGVSALILGISMIYGSVSSAFYFGAHGVKITTLAVNTLFNGICFVICAALFFIVSSLVLLTIKNIALLKTIEYASAAGTLFVVFAFLRELVFVNNGYEVLVTFTALTISGLLFYMIRRIVKRTAQRINEQKKRNESGKILRNVG